VGLQANCYYPAKLTSKCLGVASASAFKSAEFIFLVPFNYCQELSQGSITKSVETIIFIVRLLVYSVDLHCGVFDFFLLQQHFLLACWQPQAVL